MILIMSVSHKISNTWVYVLQFVQYTERTCVVWAWRDDKFLSILGLETQWLKQPRYHHKPIMGSPGLEPSAALHNPSLHGPYGFLQAPNDRPGHTLLTIMAIYVHSFNHIILIMPWCGFDKPDSL